MKRLSLSILLICTSYGAYAVECKEVQCINPSDSTLPSFENKTPIDKMENHGNVTREMINRTQGYISGDIINSTSGSIGRYFSNQGKISGSMKNEGDISGFMVNSGEIGKDLINGSKIDKNFSNDLAGIISGDMINNGYIQNIEHSAPAMENLNNISGSMINNGIVNGDFLNSGRVSQGIINSGTINGKAQIGGEKLTLMSNNAAISGAISGNDASSIYIGNTENTANYTANAGNDATAGSITVAQNSRLKLDDGVTWTATGSNDGFGITNNGTTVLDNGSVLTAYGGVNNAATLSLGEGAYTSANINGNVTNSGSIVLNPTDHSAGNTLTIIGNYTGMPGSTIRLGTVLGDDNSLTDLLNITGDTSGKSTVYVTNENGAGAQTLEGIKVIEVGGTNAADFSLGGNRVVAGAYDYSLTARPDGFYLTSTYDPKPGAVTQTVRPEVGSYTASLHAVNTLFSFSVRDREGEQNFTNTSTGERNSPSLWMRNVGGYNSASTSDRQNHTDSARYVLQIGGDVARWSTNDVNQLSLGLMGGYATQHSNTRNDLTGYRSQADISGYSAGAYATWFQNAADKTGLYADSWMQYSWFNTQVKGDSLDAEHYDSRGLSGSLESGYAMRVSQWKNAEGTKNAFYVDPHAQAVWSDVNADSFSETNGTRVSGTGNDNVQFRLGVRTYLNSKSRYDRNTVREFQPFIEANWIYNTQHYGVRMNNVAFRAVGDRNIGELKTGVEARLGERFSGWVAVAQHIGGSNYADTTGSLGVKYMF